MDVRVWRNRTGPEPSPAQRVLVNVTVSLTKMCAMRTENEICRMDAVTLAAHLKSKALSPVEAIRAVLSRMERLEPRLHAFCTPTPELALAEASRLEAEIMAGEPMGPLAGIPLSHKDLILT